MGSTRLPGLPPFPHPFLLLPESSNPFLLLPTVHFLRHRSLSPHHPIPLPYLSLPGNHFFTASRGCRYPQCHVCYNDAPVVDSRPIALPIASVAIDSTGRHGQRREWIEDAPAQCGYGSCDIAKLFILIFHFPHCPIAPPFLTSHARRLSTQSLASILLHMFHRPYLRISCVEHFTAVSLGQGVALTAP